MQLWLNCVTKDNKMAKDVIISMKLSLEGHGGEIIIGKPVSYTHLTLPTTPYV